MTYRAAVKQATNAAAASGEPRWVVRIPIAYSRSFDYGMADREMMLGTADTNILAAVWPNGEIETGA
jgi:hypothetical protein